MSRELRREIVNCLRVSGSREAELRSLGKFRWRDWESSLEWLHLSGLAMTFYDRLYKFGAEECVPPEVTATLVAEFNRHRQRVAAMTQEFDSLNGKFERAGIEYAVLKGFALIPDFCPDACLRPTYDYDYLIAEDSKDRAARVLQAAGYVCRPGHATTHSLDFSPPAETGGGSDWRDGVYSSNLQRKVELHLRLWDETETGISLTLPNGALTRRRRRSGEGLSFYALAEEDAFLFQALHTFHHILYDWCRIGWLWEIAYFVANRSQDKIFWKTLSAMVEDSGLLAEVVALVLTLARKVFNSTSLGVREDAVFRRMRAPVGLWVERYGFESALDNFSGNKYALFLYEEFVRDEATWRRIQRTRLLPFHRPNRVERAASSEPSAALPARLRQGLYVTQRLLHHTVGGVGYAWESMRWDRLRRQSTGHVLTPG